MLVAKPARAIPPFARQTGLACEACHTMPPELTAFGRRFKLSGYTLTTRPPLVNDIDDHKKNTLWLTDMPGIAVLAQIGYDHYNRAPPDTGQPYPAHAQSDTYQFPDQFSLVYAGAVSDKVGAWLQLTYNGQAGSVGVDNIDIRYSDHTSDNKWLWGVTANNYVNLPRCLERNRKLYHSELQYRDLVERRRRRRRDEWADHQCFGAWECGRYRRLRFL